ncbi:peptidoglycan DD-metalloendopeptidase family protein [Streptomyces durbertensis]|uniref:Peptidoglycan DD-metalloendopeptidase family protein n=1 Tax=Streptomyces durbertensis TaxID=2448886 RepID=A0ABR6EA16_9ACTN|nr:M23 family metallopeptidase [Streptomyces durbertensis]MBB1242078.1 peptidoglycan DD-metalloendopeptidase family protein [Streptomyces durbertensis]
MRLSSRRSALVAPGLLASALLAAGLLLSGLHVPGSAALAGAARQQSETPVRAWPSPSEVVWPLPEPLVVRGFDPPAQPWLAGHRGVDLAGAVGLPVRAVAAGRVRFAGPVAGRPVVSVELPGTGRPPLRVTYEPVDAVVTAGQEVAAGQILGTLRAGPSHCGEAGAGTRPCLHWGLRRGEHYLNPLWLVRPHRPVLLPLSD